VRAERPEIFAHGSYEPVSVEGAGRDHVIAFARRHGSEAVIVAACRLFAPLTDGGQRWNAGGIDATLDLSGYRVTRDALRGTPLTPAQPFPLADVCGALPVAVLLAQVAG
jgi:(1->4)-alpha-D-glucan 1-alpha-D-glucosylmutase